MMMRTTPMKCMVRAKMMMMMTGSRWMIDAYDACCVFSLLLCYGLYDFGRFSMLHGTIFIFLHGL
ncbi:hypothetical protein MtrunA17_Chr2g0322781 [Medicago truncatula]|uniref:Uncharacterized protein n=1 Tax=Medicago truncatula TaxID=3880 RepID=A0A396JKH7_MEDTR|nr:hypothetical protein MtrunA17_Chr2g0322781 [Medicago truncatula]